MFTLWKSLMICSNCRLLKKSLCTSNLSIIKCLTDESVIGQQVKIMGWVRSIRKMKTVLFIDVDDGTSVNCLQVILPSNEKPAGLRPGTAVDISGELVSSSGKQKVEIISKLCEVVGSFPEEEVPLNPKKEYPLDYLRQYLHLRGKSSAFSSVQRIRNSLLMDVHKFYQDRQFICVTPPVITSNNCEGASETFKIQPADANTIRSMKKRKDEDDCDVYFNKTAYLTISSQIHLEAMASCLSRVYCINSAFRAENSQSTRHLSEFIMIEAERAFIKGMDDLLQEIEDMIKYMTASLMQNKREELELIWRKHAPENEEIVINLLESPFCRVTFSEACDVLNRDSDAGDFSREEELELVKRLDNKPVFVTEWPAELKPFYMKKRGNLVDGVDLIVPRVGELCGGSLREDSYEALKQTLEENDTVRVLSWYLDLRKYGGAPLGGYGLGFERYIQLVTGLSNIKDVIPFPRWPHHCDM